jgi:serpin B
MRRFVPALAAATLSLAACGSSDVPDLPPPAAAELASVAAGNNAFAFDLFAKIGAAKGNVAFSPASIFSALTMVWGGARGETAAEIQRLLHAEGPQQQAVEAAGKVTASFSRLDGKLTLRVANRLFGEKSYSFEGSYLDQTKTWFGAPLQPLDFKNDPESGRANINQWIATATNDRIKDLLPPGSVSTDTRLVLTNAIYFLGQWKAAFLKEATRDEPFHPTPTDSKNVPMMHQSETLGFAAIGGVKVLELPYTGGEVGMTLVLPDALDGLEAIEKQLSPQTFATWIGALHQSEVDVSIPRFEVDPPRPIALKPQLQALGMKLAFERTADLTGIANPPSPEERLFISAVFHKAFVKVDEKGTEAAAATAVLAEAVASVPPPKPEFRADHPFLFFLRDLRSGLILFMGRVADPTAKG